MFGERYEITGTLEVLAPLHIGSGRDEAIPGVGGKPGANVELPAVARIIVDERRRPWLPPTTLKGMLRRIAEEALSPEVVFDLFGSINMADAGGHMGA